MGGWDEDQWYVDGNGLLGNDYLNSNIFMGQLNYYITNNKFGHNQRALAEICGLKSQSLSRFVSDEQGAKGLETPMLEGLWEYLNLGICRGSDASPGQDAVRFSEQLRAVLRASGIRPAEIAKETGIPHSVLSLFLSGKRHGLSFASIDRLWSYLGLRIYERPSQLVDPSPKGQHGFIDDGNPF